MDARRLPRTVPKVRHVGFFAPNDSPVQPSRTQSGPEGLNSPPLSDSPASNSLSPVMIPPPRHLSDNLTTRVTAAVPVPDSGYRRPNAGDNVTVGSYNTSESLLRDEEFSEDAASSQGPGFFSRSDSTKFASSFPGGGFDLMSLKSSSEAKAATATPVEVNNPVGAPEKSGGAVARVQDEQSSSSKPVKAKTTRAERRALQESQRSAKAVGRAEGNKTAAVSKATVSGKPAKQPSQRKEGPPAASSVAASEKKGVDHPPKRERKKDAPPPRMQFDDKNRVEKAKRRAVLNQMEARNQVELFRHLPQYEWGTQLPDLESNFFQVKLDAIHPAVYKVGLQYLAGDISGGNARCIAMLHAFQEAIRDYSTPAEKTLVIDLTAKIKSYVEFFSECRPLSMSMGNAIRFLKSLIISLNLSESEAKAVLCSEIDRFINEKIVLADKVIVRHAATKIRDGDVLLTHGSSCVVEMILLYSHELGKQFHVVIVDSHPKLEGQALLRRLVAKGLSCTYTHINAVSYIMHDVTRVFLGASSVLSNGTVYSRIGTSCVAMVAHAFHVPVLICCEAYKFHERVLLDSICSNELGDPDAIAKIHGRTDVNYLDDLSNTKNLQLLNLLYDATPSDYISVIITDYGMIPPTSVPVIVREYSGDHLWM